MLEQKPFSLATCVDEVINLLALTARRNKINLISFIEPHVPAGFLGDAARVRQILLNIIRNAVKFTDVGEVILQVNSVPVKDHIYRLEFLVSDTGMGISAEAPSASISSSSSKAMLPPRASTAAPASVSPSPSAWWN